MLEQSGQIQGLALIFWEFPTGRSIVEVMTTPELAGNSGEIDLVQQSVAKVESQKLSGAHICVMADSGMGKVLEQAGFTEVRSFQTGDTPLLTQVQNDAFTGSWGFCPNTSKDGTSFLIEGNIPADYC